jgi:hypothetical protein
LRPVATVIVLAILVGLFGLVWHGSLAGTDVLPLVAGLATAAVGIFGVAHGVQAGAKAARPPNV